MEGLHGDLEPRDERFRRGRLRSPCPPKGHGLHRYRCMIWAHDTPRLELGEAPSYDEVKANAEGDKIGGAPLTGTYER